jgi:two-component system chemotaxis response regulator CheB
MSIKVLIVDDSALVRQILKSGLDKEPGIEVVGTAVDPYQARDLIVRFHPDVMTLDVEMPRMNGLEFLKKLIPQYPIPVIMVSSLTEQGSQVTMNALALGALDFVTKPKSNLKNGLQNMMYDLILKVKTAYENKNNIKINLNLYKNIKNDSIDSLKHTTDKIVAIGSSTGGTEALAYLVKQFPENFPGMIIVQHMPAVFTASFAKRLDSISKMSVKEAEDRDRVIDGRILVAEGSKQLRVERTGGHYIVRVGESDLISGHCPSVDALFESVANHVGANAIGLTLTGMGKDGAEGMLKMKQRGAVNIAQDENSCVVYGMPKAAVDIGAIDYIVPLDRIAYKLKTELEKNQI